MPLPSREQAFELLCQHLAGEYLRRHSLATEAILERLAHRLGADPELWSRTGLLHDLDLELVGDDFSRHGRETVRILKERFDYPPEGLQAILAHNGDLLGIPCVSPLDHALTAAESMTGMVFATALILPTKRLEDVKAKSVAKRLKEPRFAANVSRERVSHHNDLGMDVHAFCALALESMQSIAGEVQG